MPETALQSGFDREASDAFLSARREPGWTTELRRAALARFMALPLPDTNQEEWRRTDVRLLRLNKFGVPGDLTPGLDLPLGMLTQGVELSGRTTALNSRHVETQLDPQLA